MEAESSTESPARASSLRLGGSRATGTAKRGMQLGKGKKDPVVALAADQGLDEDGSGWGEDDDLNLDVSDIEPASRLEENGWSESEVSQRAKPCRDEDAEKEARRQAREARKAEMEKRRLAKTAASGGLKKKKGLGAVKKD